MPTVYFIGGPFDLTKRIMSDPGRYYAMAVLPPLYVPPLTEPYPPIPEPYNDSIKLEEAKYRRLRSVTSDPNIIIFEYMPP